MDLQISLRKILKKGSLGNELEFQRASIIDRQLRLLVKTHPELSEDRKALRAILKDFEDRHWMNSEITDLKVDESDLASQIAEHEYHFNMHRKQLIRTRLKERGLTQKDLGLILGHTSETYMSELINGMSPFTLNDLVLIHRLLNIDLAHLIPTTLNTQIIRRILKTVASLNKPKFQIVKRDLVGV
ncbi:MAG: helix-turn-helix transcriptional regulator [Bacteroidota bacterium]